MRGAGNSSFGMERSAERSRGLTGTPRFYFSSGGRAHSVKSECLQCASSRLHPHKYTRKTHQRRLSTELTVSGSEVRIVVCRAVHSIDPPAGHALLDY